MVETQQQQPQTFLGMPMSWDFDPAKMVRNYWNPDDERVFPPKVFGIGWDVNFHAVYRLAGVLSDTQRQDDAGSQ